jgi:hypothetical protein
MLYGYTFSNFNFENFHYFCYRYQKELPKKIKARGKEAHLTHEEIVQCIKWKLAVSMFKFFYRHLYLRQLN